MEAFVSCSDKREHQNILSPGQRLAASSVLFVSAAVSLATAVKPDDQFLFV